MHRSLVDDGLACFGAGEFSGADGGFRDRRLRSHGVVFVSEGAGVYVDGSGRTSDVRAPALISLFPAVPHGYASPSGWTEHWLLFGGAMTTALEDAAALSRWAPVRRLHRMPAGLTEGFRQLSSLLTATDRLAQLSASAIVLGLVAASAEEDVDQYRSDPLVRALTADASETMSVAGRARRLGVSPAELRARVKSATGLTPHGLIVNARITQARNLLASTDRSIESIARSVGYDDPAYFSRIFAFREGVPPAGFRALQRRLAGASDAVNGTTL
ncbi:helix-turn-helix domain-containing protein [Microbacterium sp. CR_7]|uniref:helix-turn-helix domain-containing protein n=1 Tax=Microbacterium sp. CR_7 TaxID=3055792 RepID=UPI0035C21F81